MFSFTNGDALFWAVTMLITISLITVLPALFAVPSALASLKLKINQAVLTLKSNLSNKQRYDFAIATSSGLFLIAVVAYMNLLWGVTTQYLWIWFGYMDGDLNYFNITGKFLGGTLALFYSYKLFNKAKEEC